MDRRTTWRSIGKEKDGEKKVVPWFSMSEWKTVRDFLYSDSTSDHQLGYNRLRGWKARCNNLPEAVECSVSIFHVLLGDPDYFSPRATTLIREQELRLMYSTAVMRFLNLMLGAHNEDLSGNMYSRASMRNIPEWLVNLRHDAAHGVAVPELSLLRAAALFIRRWLYEYYWGDDIQETTDWVVSREDISSSSILLKELHNIIEAWEALSLYKLSGFSNLSQIPYSDLRCSIEVIQKLQQSMEDGDKEVPNEILRNKPAKVSSALTLVESRLKNFMIKNLQTIEIQDALCDILIGGDVLLPSENFLRVMNPDGDLSLENLETLPSPLEDHWEGMMYTLWEVESVPFLLKRLISASTDGLKANLQSRLAALWAQKLVLSCIKVREARKVHCAIASQNKLNDIFTAYKPSLQYSNRKEVLASVSIAAVENQREDLKKAYTWKLSPLPESLLSMEIVRHAFSSPPPDFCHLFLPNLFELVSPPIPENIQARLFELMKICHQGEFEHVVAAEDKLYSVSDLFSNSNSAPEESTDISRSLQEKVKNPWVPGQEHLNWGACPLGLLPWQQKQQHHDLEEYEQRQQKRTWSRLSLDGQWKAHETSDDNISESPSQSSNTQVMSKDKLRSVQNGRVSRLKMFTPKQNEIKAFRKLSPNIAQKAIKFLQEC